jgi:hypothetical protein
MFSYRNFPHSPTSGGRFFSSLAGAFAEQKPCIKGGCSGNLCSDSKDIASICDWKESYVYSIHRLEGFLVCFCDASDFDSSSPLSLCLSITIAPGQMSCRCYQQQECARNAEGVCQWTNPDALRACIASYAAQDAASSSGGGDL